MVWMRPVWRLWSGAADWSSRAALQGDDGGGERRWKSSPAQTQKGYKDWWLREGGRAYQAGSGFTSSHLFALLHFSNPWNLWEHKTRRCQVSPDCPLPGFWLCQLWTEQEKKKKKNHEATISGALNPDSFTHKVLFFLSYVLCVTFIFTHMHTNTRANTCKNKTCQSSVIDWSTLFIPVGGSCTPKQCTEIRPCDKYAELHCIKNVINGSQTNNIVNKGRRAPGRHGSLEAHQLCFHTPSLLVHINPRRSHLHTAGNQRCSFQLHTLIGCHEQWQVQRFHPPDI